MTEFNLNTPNGRKNADRFFEDQIRESFATWDDHAALADLSYDEYFETHLDGDGALYNSADYQGKETLLISAEEHDEAEGMFSAAMNRVYRDWLFEKSDDDATGPGTLRVVCTESKLFDAAAMPRIEATFASSHAEYAEAYASALEENGNGDYRFHLFEETEDGAYRDVDDSAEWPF